ncbi:peptidase [Mycobacterium talmoniae]|uniref:Peptidase n=2 Tax=Mycobacterium talmoniae TaxID=1858794 RepID=A0A1S1MY96_9MYCO|nr:MULTISPECIES: peptidase [Mycobacterium]OHU93760.1 peptidase [Mycobacterium talmoniae]TDH51526.1 peptidase [Mycobacterium eburneum]
MKRQRRRWGRSGIAAAVVGACAALTLSGCSDTVDGRAVSVLDDPWRVGGLPVTDGPTGPVERALAPIGTVQNTDGGAIDRLALLSINDIQDYWKQNYAGFTGSFAPVDTLISYGSKNPTGMTICGVNTYQYVNAFYCYGRNLIAWDRGVLLPAVKDYFGDMSVTAALAHEYGHAVEDMARLVTKSTPMLVAEQQADCFTGAYLRWVAEGKSSRFTLNTADGLDEILAGLITLRDPLLGPHDKAIVGEAHGTALDRISALQLGFDTAVGRCAAIDADEITQRRGDMPMSLQRELTGAVQTGEVAITKATLATLVEGLNATFHPARPPTLAYNDATCAAAPAAYCPATNTIGVDLPALQHLAVAADELEDRLLPQGDNTALSVVMSRYMLALQHQRGLDLASATTALRTACLTGVGQRSMFAPHGTRLRLTAGDVDEAVTGLLMNGLAASDVGGATVPAGFTRIQAFRAGLTGDAERCYQRFP